MLIETSENIDVFVDGVRAYSLNREQSGAISFQDHRSVSNGTIFFNSRDVLVTFTHALQKIQRY